MSATAQEIPAKDIRIGDRIFNDAAEEWQTVRELRRPYAKGVLVNGRWYYSNGTLVRVQRA
jgi:hypothetical protein